MFRWRTSYKKIIENFALDAMSVDPMQAPGVADAPSDEAGHSYNALEGVAAILFLSQRALEVLGNSDRFEKARDHLTSVFFSVLDQQYSKSEMRSLVLPLLERRHLEYETILNSSGEPGSSLIQLGNAIIARCFEGDFDDTQRNAAIAFLLNELMIKPARQLKVIEESDKIKW